MRGLAVLILCLWPVLGLAQAEQDGPGGQGARVGQLLDLLQMDDLLDAVRAEGLGTAQDLGDETLDPPATRRLMQQARGIYGTARLQACVRAVLGQALDTETLDASIRFLSGDLGRRVVTLETSARVAMTDLWTQDKARTRYAEISRDDPLLAAVTRFADATDLLGRNNSASMAAIARFYDGLADGGFLDPSYTDIGAELRAQRAEVEADNRDWLYGFMLLAYGPLTPEDFDAYTTFYASPPGQRLNAAIFDAFDRMGRDTSYDLGLALARIATERDL
ncbi:MAG: hypothetical protein OIF47_16080 [Marinibacterium sp.]|nr:hypothetical protein [Marinibacterium sp.]